MSALIDAPVSVFDRVVCAFDGSPDSVEAAKQAELLRDGLGTLELIGVFEAPAAVYSDYGAPLYVSEAERAFADRFEAGRSEFRNVPAEVLQGSVVPRILEQLEESDATLLAVGATDHSRPVGIVLRSVATELLHRARCSVLLARHAWDPVLGPRSIVVGYDGSPQARRALSVGCDLGARLPAALRVVVAGNVVPIEATELDGLTVARDDRAPVDAVREASNTADLLLVGSRGLQGLKALGSVSERLGHQSACSILIVRDDDRV